MEDKSHEELYEHHFFEVEKNHDLIRIDKFLLLRLPNTSRNKIQKSILSGCVFCNDCQIKPNYKVKPYDKILIDTWFLLNSKSSSKCFFTYSSQ